MSKKILLADDSITIQKVVSITLVDEEYDLIIIGDGDTAIDRAREIIPDLIIADIAMPGKNGYEVCEAIKKEQRLQHIPVLLLSGTFEPLNEKEAQRVKADDYIIKPFESQELIDKVKKLLSSSYSVPVKTDIPATSEIKATIPLDIWDIGDFVGVKEVQEPIKEGTSFETEQDLWGNEFFEESLKEKTQKPEEEEFIELQEEELQPIEEIKEITAETPEVEVKETPANEVVELGAIPKDKLEEVIRVVSREIIENIAWEVVPDLAETLIKEEIRKIKEAITKIK